MRRPGAHAVGIVSQSGALGFALAQAVEHGSSFSHMLTAGNSCDVDVADLVAYLLSPQADYITGTTVTIDGALSLTVAQGA